MNNYERIKQMTVDEMAEWLDNITHESSTMFKQWLLREVKDE